MANKQVGRLDLTERGSMERGKLSDEKNYCENYSTSLFVTEMLYLITNIQPATIHAQDSLLNDLAMDSIEFIDLLIRLENIGVKIPESNLNSQLTVSDIVNYIDNAAGH